MPTRRAGAAPEPIDVRTSDGWSLRTEVHEPAGDALGVAVLAHALMARRTEFDRPRGAGLARFFVDRGWRVVTFDFRGHGDSVWSSPGAALRGYDDFVQGDLPAIHAFARSRTARTEPVVLVGHSLGGHAALAAQGTGLVAFDGLVAVAASPWLRELEPSNARWLVKRAALSAALAVTRRVGHFPARALRLGSDDETGACLSDMVRFARTGAWTSADGRVDYLASVSRVRAPVLHIASDGDRLECPPACAVRFAAICGGPFEVLRAGRTDDCGPPPGHMALVTSGRARCIWERAEGWMRVSARIDSSRI